MFTSASASFTISSNFIDSGVAITFPVFSSNVINNFPLASCAAANAACVFCKSPSAIFNASIFMASTLAFAASAGAAITFSCSIFSATNFCFSPSISLICSLIALASGLLGCKAAILSFKVFICPS